MGINVAGYSGKPLADKLGLKDGQVALFVNLPEEVAELASCRDFASSECVEWGELPEMAKFDLVHAFTTRKSDLSQNAETIREWIMPEGMAWISWPKKASKVPTDITEDSVREVLLPCGLVDVKVCAVTEIWSGLKLVVRKELRKH